MKALKVFPPRQEQASLTSHRQESQSNLAEKGSDHTEPAKELSSEKVIAMLISETVCLRSKICTRSGT